MTPKICLFSALAYSDRLGLTLRTRLAVNAQRTVVYIAAGDTLYLISVGDATLTLLGSVGGPPELNAAMSSIAITPDNTAVFVGSSNQAVWFSILLGLFSIQLVIICRLSLPSMLVSHRTRSMWACARLLVRFLDRLLCLI